MELNEDFLKSLKESLMALDQRISVLEHIVNDDIIGGYKEAADKLIDDENYSIFVDEYKGDFEPYEGIAKKYYNDEEFDLGGDLYDKIKELDHSAEGFDEKAEVVKLLEELKAKIEETKAQAEQLVSDLTSKAEPEVVEIKKEEEPELDEESEEFWDQPDALKKFRAKHNIKGE